MLWHAGHALWLQDVLCVQLLTRRRELPPGWAETFGINCWPVKETEEWPNRDEIREFLRTQLDRVVELLAATSDM